MTHQKNCHPEHVEGLTIFFITGCNKKVYKSLISKIISIFDVNYYLITHNTNIII